MGSFGRCSDSSYEEGRSRLYKDSSYPNGCSPYIDAAGIQNNITWVTPLDNYDNIWYSMQSVLRVFLMNEWHYLLFTSTDAVGVDLNPRKDAHPEAFVFYVLLVLVAMVLNCLFISVIYYHYAVSRLMGTRKFIRGVKEALWIIYEVKRSF